MHKELTRISIALLISFALVAASAAYWSVFESDGMLARPDNLRETSAELNLERGKIYDRNGIALASGRQGARRYPHAGVGGAIGFYDYVYGAAGLEAAYNSTLNGDIRNLDTWAQFRDNTLHIERDGYDLRSTIDLRIQQNLDRSLGDYQGAAVLVRVPSGEVLAMVSHPNFNLTEIKAYVEDNGEPIDESDTHSPLFNRVRQGSYQPGGVMSLILLTGMLNANTPLDTPVVNGAIPVEFDGEPYTIGCASLPPNPEEMTLLDAFVYSCPHPFLQMFGSTFTLENYQSLLHTLGLLAEPSIDPLQTAIAATPVPLSQDPNLDQELMRTVVGQGKLTINPLQMSLILAAITNQGNAVPLHLADAYRTEEGWQALEIPILHPALLQENVALLLKQVLITNAQRSPAITNAISTDLVIRDYELGGFISRAYSGDGVITWFNGFVTTPDGSSLTLVLIIEDAVSDEIVAKIAGEAFTTAVLALEADAPEE